MATALQASSHLFFEQLRYEFSLEPVRKHLPSATALQSTPPSSLKVAWFAFRQDATNGRDKYSTMILDGAFIHLDPTDPSYSGHASQPANPQNPRQSQKMDWSDLVTRISRTSDMLPIEDETGRGCFAFSHKAFRSLGCPTPLDFYCQKKKNQKDQTLASYLWNP